MRKLFLLLVFVCGVSQAQEIDYCSKIEFKKDKFTGLEQYNSPILDRVVFFKSKSGVKIRIDIPGNSLSTGEKGVILLLSDNSQIKKPNEKVFVSAGTKFRYSASFYLNTMEIERITKNPITAVKLYIYEADVFDPEKYSEYLKCLAKM